MDNAIVIIYGGIAVVFGTAGVVAVSAGLCSYGFSLLSSGVDPRFLGAVLVVMLIGAWVFSQSYPELYIHTVATTAIVLFSASVAMDLHFKCPYTTGLFLGVCAVCVWFPDQAELNCVFNRLTIETLMKLYFVLMYGACFFIHYVGMKKLYDCWMAIRFILNS